MAFYLYSGNKLETLAERYRTGLHTELARDPFTPETIVVQTQGMSAWLKLRLASESGIVANCDTPFLNNFIMRVLAAAFPERCQSDLEQLSPELMSFKLYGLLENTPALAPELAGYLTGENVRLKRWQLACRIAALFDQYQIYRPEMLDDWRKAPRTPAAKWQQQLYEAISADCRGREYYFNEFQKLDALPPGAAPRQLTVFGVGAMPPLYLKFFTKLAEFSDVHFFYLNPSRSFWGDLQSPRQQNRLIERDGVDPAEFEENNPLLAGLCGQGREFFELLLDIPEELNRKLAERPDAPIPELFAEELFEDYVGFSGQEPGPDGYERPSRLTAMQQDILDMYNRSAQSDGVFIGSPFEFEPDDRSVELHNCHSARREVEVLHDRLLELLQDPEIQPREVIVMAPDINTYAPCINAVFGSGPLKECFAVSDRSLRQSSRIADAFFELLELVGGRFEASGVLGLLELPAIRDSFGIADSELPLLGSWVERAGIRWGIDGAERRELCGVAFEEYSWRQGIDRLLAGYARSAGSADFNSDSPLPADAVSGGSAPLFGHFIKFAYALFELKPFLAGLHTPQEWSAFLDRLLADFFTCEGEEAVELAALRRAVLAPGERAQSCAIAPLLECAVLREMVEQNLVQTGRNDPFLRGKITFCTLTPMRSIPMKAVAILGLREGEFPRRDFKLGFNLMSLDPRKCDRSRQAEDRYLFLEALLSARRKLLFFYQGQSARGDELFPPAVPLSEVIDYLSASSKAPFRECRHHLQAFDWSAFDPAVLAGQPELRSYSRPNFLAAQTLLARLHAPHRTPPPLLLRQLPEPEPEHSVPLDELEKFFASPCRWFLRNRADLIFSEFLGQIPDEEPWEIDRLAAYLLKTDICRWSAEGFPAEAQYRFLLRAGRLPLGENGRRLFEEEYATVRQLTPFWCDRIAHPERILIDRRIEAGRTLRVTGSVNGIYRSGAVDITLHTFGKYNLKHAMRLELHHLLSTLQHPEQPVTTRLLTFEGNGPAESLLEPISCEAAADRCRTLFEAFETGRHHPLPVFHYATTAYFQADGKSRDERYQAAKAQFRKSFKKNGTRDDLDDPAIRCCYTFEDFDNDAFREEFCFFAETLLPDARRGEPLEEA